MSDPVTFTVFGEPVGQGNIRYNRSGRGYHANGTELEGWRTLVRGAAARATGFHAFVRFGGRKQCVHCHRPPSTHGVFLGAVMLDAVVAFTRPATVRRPYPTTRRHGDFDHHARAISDALTGVLYPDDSQVIDGRVRQVYAGPDAPIPEPGALITVKELPLGD